MAEKNKKAKPPRIITEEYEKLKNDFYKATLARSERFKELKSQCSTSTIEQCKEYLDKIIENGNFDLHDLISDANDNEFWLKNQDDTHAKNRLFEKAMGGKCDSLPIPDRNDGEIKLTQITKEHNLEQVITIGRIQPENCEKYPCFEQSCTFKKMQKMLVVSYVKEGGQLGRKLFNPFIFEVENPKWFSRIKEDWDYYHKEYYKSLKENHKKPSGYMKSDTSGGRCPNHTLGIRTDSIIITKSFFQEVSEYYANI